MSKEKRGGNGKRPEEGITGKKKRSEGRVGRIKEHVGCKWRYGG